MKCMELIVLVAVVAIAVTMLPVVYAATAKSLDVERDSSQYASISDGSQTGLDITGDITVEAWIKFESLPTSGQEWNVAGKWGNAQNAGQSYAISFYENGGTVYLRGIVNDGSDLRYISMSGSFTAGAWYHIAFSWRASDSSMKLYVNGADTGVSAAGVAIDSILNGNAPFWVGTADYSGDGSADAYFDGLIDEVKVWDSVRTSAEVANDYDAELTGSEAHLKGYWKFNNDYLDETANNNDLTSSGSPAFSEAIPYIKILNQ